MSAEEDRDAAHRWHAANAIRKEPGSVRSKILKFLQTNVGRGVTNEELRYVAGDKTEWARRVRELRTEHGWPIATKTTGRPDLGVGVYVLEADRQSPEHDRSIPDDVRREVLRRDGYALRTSGRSRGFQGLFMSAFLSSKLVLLVAGVASSHDDRGKMPLPAEQNLLVDEVAYPAVVPKIWTVC